MTEDLIELGMRADGERQRRFPDGIVTYCLEKSPGAVAVVIDPGNPDLESLRVDSDAVIPVCPPGTTGVEFLKAVALCRLHTSAAHVQLDPDWCGLKMAQIALRFGADDFGCGKFPEEEVRRIIRDAGFLPKKRDASYSSLSIL